MKKTAIIIGCGPAGLTAALELLNNTDVKPVIIEATHEIGGISKTHLHNGNRMDMGGHRFFSKSEWVMDWWQKIMPVQGAPALDDIMLNRSKSLSANGPDPQKIDRVMLVRERISRIFFLRKFFNYPITLDFTTMKNLGLVRMLKCGFSYLFSRFNKIKHENSLEDFFVNRFGRELYNTFFKDYTTKVWGVDPSKIAPDWGGQRIKELSITKILLHAIKSIFRKKSDINQKNVETSLIEQFIYPKFGPGQLWETVAQLIREQGGEIHFGQEVKELSLQNNSVTAVIAVDDNGNKHTYHGDYYLSTMPVKQLIAGIKNAPKEVNRVAQGLVYRDFMTVGLLVKKLRIKNLTDKKTVSNIVPDSWIYIQEREVELGRLQIFNNWSPYMVKDLENTVWIGLEYFCNQGDKRWNMSDKAFIDFAIDELCKIEIIDRDDVLDSCRVKVPKAYPAYFGTYAEFDVIKEYVNSVANLYLMGRNGMHRYNNIDHSMLTARFAVENIKNGVTSKDNMWNINADEQYHESR